MATRRLLAGLVFVLAGCATTENYERQLRRWDGAHADELVKAWGPPRTARALPDGGQELEYVIETTHSPGGWAMPRRATSPQNGQGVAKPGPNGPGVAKPNGAASPGGGRAAATRGSGEDVVMSRCVTRFVTDAQRIVRMWRFEGNGCVSISP